MTTEQIREAVARGWCHPTTERLVMDPVLAEAIAEEVYRADTRPNLGLATTRELLAELVARTEVDGSADYRTCDYTGTRTESETTP